MESNLNIQHGKGFQSLSVHQRLKGAVKIMVNIYKYRFTEYYFYGGKDNIQIK